MTGVSGDGIVSRWFNRVRPGAASGALVVLLAAALWPAVAAASDMPPVMSFQSENDLYGDGKDRWYTNGFRLAFAYPAGREPALFSWIEDVLPGGPEVARSDAFFAIGQHMFTPADITRKRLLASDRPWAGWLYLEVGVSGSKGPMQETLTLSVGVTGPASLARQTQKLVHRLTGSPQPRGWEFQLRTEPTLQLFYERAWFLKLFDLGTGAALDVSPRLGADLGSVFIDGNGGVVIRLGNFLPAALPPRINPSATGAGKILRPRSEGIGWYLFAGFEGRAVARNLFLDGNTFARSHSVAKRTAVRELSAGVALSFHRFALSYTFVRRSREFALQPEGQGFGSINLSLAF